MPCRKVISVTLDRDNVIWLKGRADAAGCNSVSEFLDRLVTAARFSGQAAPPRPAVGTTEMEPSASSLEPVDERFTRASADS